MLIMHSRSASAASSASDSGTEITGLAAMVIRPRSCPGPGVAISSAMHDAGTWPRTSGAPRTRDVQLPNVGSPVSLLLVRKASGKAMGSPNMSVPGRSKWPAQIAKTSTRALASVPNSWLHNPMRP